MKGLNPSRCIAESQAGNEAFSLVICYVSANRLGTDRASEVVGVNRNTAAYYFKRLRVIISEHLEEEAREFIGGEIEVDESYFGGRRKWQARSWSGRQDTCLRPVKAGRVGLYEDHTGCRRRNFDADHSGKSDTRQHCLFRLLAGL